jgi:hypothetical protein
LFGTKTSAVSGMTMHESVSINTAISAMLQCLRSIKNNSENLSSNVEYNDTENISPAVHNTRDKMSHKAQIVPYRENKLTMLVQPLFSGNFKG